MTDAHVSILLRSGVIARDAAQRDHYRFAVAGVGPVVKSLIKGRKVRTEVVCYIQARVAIASFRRSVELITLQCPPCDIDGDANCSL